MMSNSATECKTVGDSISSDAQHLCRQILPLNLDPSYTINDNLNEFVKYSLSSLLLTQNIYASKKSDSIKIDFWIIPQFARCSKNDHVFELNQILNDDNYYNFNGLGKIVNNKQMKRELIKQILPKILDDDMNDYGELDSNILAQCATIIDTEIVDYDINHCIDYIPPHLINLIKKDDHKFVVSPLWNLEQHLNKAGFIENKDYWCQYAKDNAIKLQQQLHEMWRNANHVNNNRCNRYIFIVDRRNPENLKNNNMEYKKPNYNKTSKDWRDKILLIANAMTSKSSDWLFVNDEKESDGINMFDTLNGYKFVLSYNLSNDNSSKTKFVWNDMKILNNLNWAQYFVNIDGKEQKLNIKLLEY